METSDAINYDDVPDWAFDMAAISEITAAQAAHVMIGHDPDDLSSMDKTTLRQWGSACSQLDEWECKGRLKPLRVSGADRAYFDPNEIKRLALDDGWLWLIPTREELDVRNASRLNVIKMAIREKAKTRINDPAPADAIPGCLRQLKAENARLAEQVAELQRQLQEATAAQQQTPKEDDGKPASRWPWGDHHTEALGHLEAAGLRFWQRFDPTDPTTAPINETVADWLVSEHGVGKDRARSIASLLRADGLPHGPRR